eukprot:GFYU01002283.1.p1 GENE.GFYU01002283.1~~GFYU01002283.1.p1  ORF type:complete len:658 (-),score=225.87 GFYU01002283.1:293-2266(-)
MATVLSQTKPIDPSNIDDSVSPGLDFNLYANGKWMANNPCPDDYSRWGVFEQLVEKNNLVLREIVEDAAGSGAEKGSNKQKVGDFWWAATNTEKIEADGAKGVEPLFAEIDAITDKDNLLVVVAKLHRLGISSMFGFGALEDLKNSSQTITWLDSSGLGLPDRDYYFEEDKAENREQYLAYVANMFKLLGVAESEAKAHADTVMKVEKSLAEKTLTKVERRDPMNLYHKMTLDELNTNSKNINWQLYFDSVGLKPVGEINVTTPDFLTRNSELLESVSVDEWKVYLKSHVLKSMAPFMSQKFEEEHFDFYDRKLKGQKEMKPRWKRILALFNSKLGELVGEVYCSKAFPASSKEKAVAIVNQLKEALKHRLMALKWMSDATKERAMKKMNTFGVKIGYPDKWIDYTALDIDRDMSFATIIMKSNEFEHNRDLDRMNKPADSTRWEMPPHMVNAYYHPLKNEIVFPAAILQFPFFSPEIDPVVNFGAMGVVIAHEMTHAYDDEGRKFDETGNMSDWWTEDDASRFNERSQLIVDQFNKYEVNGKNVNGKLTAGENIADLGGLQVAYQAMLEHLATNPATKEPIEGFSAEQRFFLAYAQLWRCNIKEAEVIRRLAIDPHSPNNLRVNGPLSNMPEFYSAFTVNEGDAMFRKDGERVDIW